MELNEAGKLAGTKIVILLMHLLPRGAGCKGWAAVFLQDGGQQVHMPARRSSGGLFPTSPAGSRVPPVPCHSAGKWLIPPARN